MRDAENNEIDEGGKGNRGIEGEGAGEGGHGLLYETG